MNANIPLIPTNPNPAGYTAEEIDALPTNVASWDASLFKGPYLTVKELRDYKARKPTASVTPAYGFPCFRVGDTVEHCHDGEAHRIVRVVWYDCTGCGHYSFWRVVVPGVSDEQCNFHPMDASAGIG